MCSGCFSSDFGTISYAKQALNKLSLTLHNLLLRPILEKPSHPHVGMRGEESRWPPDPRRSVDAGIDNLGLGNFPNERQQLPKIPSKEHDFLTERSVSESNHRWKP